MMPRSRPIESDAPIREAAEIMARADIGGVIVVEGGQNRGIVTDRDIAIRLVGEGATRARWSDAQVMTPFPASIEPTASVHGPTRSCASTTSSPGGGTVPVGMIALADLSWAPGHRRSSQTSAPRHRTDGLGGRCRRLGVHELPAGRCSSSASSWGCDRAGSPPVLTNGDLGELLWTASQEESNHRRRALSPT